ncbi:MAG: DUF3592 domain-containing protein [Chthoniobacteraceae bacterium]
MTDQLEMGVPSLAIGLWFFWANRKGIEIGWRSRKWKPIKGKIVDSRLQNMRVGRVAGSIVGRFFSRSQRSFTFEYHVGGNIYTSGKYSAAEVLDEPPSEWMCSQRVTVYYDPAAPENCVAKRGIQFVPLIPAIGFCLCGVYLLLSR